MFLCIIRYLYYCSIQIYIQLFYLFNRLGKIVINIKREFWNLSYNVFYFFLLKIFEFYFCPGNNTSIIYSNQNNMK